MQLQCLGGIKFSFWYATIILTDPAAYVN